MEGLAAAESQSLRRDGARPSNLGHLEAVVANRWNVDTMIHFGVVLEANRRRYWKL
jgi:hypothetical protein